MIALSVKSKNMCKSVILTNDDIVKAHGGEISVESLPAGQAGEQGEGTSFIISLPFKINQ